MGGQKKADTQVRNYRTPIIIGSFLGACNVQKMADTQVRHYQTTLYTLKSFVLLRPPYLFFVVDLLRTPETTAQRAHIFGGDECIRVGLQHDRIHPVHILALDGQIKHGHHSILATGRDLRDPKTGFPKLLHHQGAAMGTDHADGCMPNRQTVLRYTSPAHCR